MMKEYRGKSGTVEAMQIVNGVDPHAILEFALASQIDINSFYGSSADGTLDTQIETLTFSLYDYVVKDESGRVHVFNPEVFDSLFEEVNAEQSTEEFIADLHKHKAIRLDGHDETN